jgi:transposase/DNA-binding CsgD family transcriptional regulator
MPRVAQKVMLSDADREHLETLLRQRSTGQAMALRARIVLMAAKGELLNGEIAVELGTSQQTVGKWRSRFIKLGIDGLADEPRPGAPRTINDDRVQAIVTATLESAPPGSTHWSLRDLAQRSGVSRETVRRIWQAFRLQPHREGTFKLSKDPLLVDKIRDIVGLYVAPPERAIVLCVDEKSQIQALERTQQILPMTPGRIAMRTCDYRRHGTTSLFAALDVATGKVIGACMSKHRSQEFIRFLNQIDANTPADFDLHLVLDNYATHKTPAVKRWLARHPRFHVHFTPTSGSWLNQVERWFAGLTDKALRRSVHRSVGELTASIEAYIVQANKQAKPYCWVKSATEIIDSIGRFCLRTGQKINAGTSVS